MFIMTVVYDGEESNPPAIEVHDTIEEAVSSAKDYISSESPENIKVWSSIKQELLTKRRWESSSHKIKIEIKGAK